MNIYNNIYTVLRIIQIRCGAIEYSLMHATQMQNDSNINASSIEHCLHNQTLSIIPV